MSRKYKVIIFLFLIFIGLPLLKQKSQAQEETDFLESTDFFEPRRNQFPEAPSIKPVLGHVSGFGTEFQITDSEYLNLKLEINPATDLVFESVPEMITLDLEPNPANPNAEIKISGLEANKEYHFYEDSYENHQAVKSDEEGSVTFFQDLTLKHHLFIQPTPSTKTISDNPTGGDCTLIGTWNSLSKTCLLTKDLTETINITSNGLTLDGNFHKITGSGTGYGIQANSRGSLTLKNLTIENFSMGIYLYNSTGNTVKNNTVKNNTHSAVYLYYRSKNNLITNNTLSNNAYFGLNIVNQSENNQITNNHIFSNSSSGINLNASLNQLSGNEIYNNKDSGILVNNAHSQTIANNEIYENMNSGIYLKASSSNILQNNYLSENSSQDLYLETTSDGNCNQTLINNLGSGGNPIGFINSSGNYNGGNYSQLILCNADHTYLSNVTISGSVTIKNNGLYLLRTDGTTLSDIISQNNKYGAYFHYSTNNQVLTGSGLTANLTGLYLNYSDNNSLSNQTIADNEDGIVLNYSKNIILANNLVSNNLKNGIALLHSDYSSLNDNLIENNASATTFDNDYYGLIIEDSQGLVLRNNRMRENFYNFGMFSWNDQYFNNDIDISNLAEGKPILIYINTSGQTIDGSTLEAAAVYCINCLDVSIKNFNFNHQFAGVYLRKSRNCLVENVRVDSSYIGVYGQYSQRNTIKSSIFDNSRYGILFSPFGGCSEGTCKSNIVRDNSLTNNYYGFYFNADLTTVLNNLFEGNEIGANVYGPNSLIRNNSFKNNKTGLLARVFADNQIYNNNFINNLTQVNFQPPSPILNKSAPTGGNYWSDWDTPDSNNDGFVDFPYAYDALIQDAFPWTKESGWLPSTSVSFSGLEGNNGWYKSDVSVTLTATDNEGIDKIEHSFDQVNWLIYISPFLINAEGEQTIYYKATDINGDQEKIKQATIKIDKTPPAITSLTTEEPNELGWYKNDITIIFSAADDLSGVESVSPNQLISTEGENQTVTGTASDKAGNVSSLNVSGINLDKTSPEITLNLPSDGATYLLSEVVIADWSAVDTLSGIIAASGTSASGEKFNTETLGEIIFTVTAKDKAGNESQINHNYFVHYDFSDFLSPLNSENEYKIKSTIPIKFILKDSAGQVITDAAAKLFLINARGQEQPATSKVNTENLFRFDLTDNIYLYNLETTNLTPGVWQIRAELSDGAIYFANLNLR